MKPSIYLYERQSGVSDSFLIQLLTAEVDTVGGLFQKIPTAGFKDLVTFVDTPEHAEFMMLPHTYFVAKKIPGYLEGAEAFAKQYELKTVIFTNSDFHQKIHFYNSVVIRTASYRSSLDANEVIIPAFVEDLGAEWGVIPREKESEPKLCFHGKVGTDTFMREVKYLVRLGISIGWTILGKKTRAEWQGLHYRRTAIKHIKRGGLPIDLGERKTFSAAKDTIAGDPATIRAEFVAGIQNADLPLVVRGDGNYSLRFFEVLALGRVPLFIDTDTPLPLEDMINYDEFILRIDHTELHRLPELVRAFWSDLTPEQYQLMQQKARQAFEQHLRADAFYKIFFDQLASGKWN